MEPFVCVAHDNDDDNTDNIKRHFLSDYQFITGS
jgi:hypothetical protein